MPRPRGRSYRRSRISRPGRDLRALGLVLFILSLWTLGGPFGLWKYHRMREDYARTYRRLAALETENRRLEEQIRRLETDPRFQEEAVRRGLGWVRDRELVFRFLGEK